MSWATCLALLLNWSTNKIKWNKNKKHTHTHNYVAGFDQTCQNNDCLVSLSSVQDGWQKFCRVFSWAPIAADLQWWLQGRLGFSNKKTNSLEKPTLSAVSHNNHWLFPHLWMFLIVIPQKTNETAKIMVKSMVTNHSPTISGTTQFRSLLQFVVNESCCFTALTVAAWALGMRLGRKWAKQSIHLWLFYSRDRMFKDIQKWIVLLIWMNPHDGYECLEFGYIWMASICLYNLYMFIYV